MTNLINSRGAEIEDLLEEMKKQGATRLQLAAARGDYAAIKELILKGGNMAYRDHRGRSLIHYSVEGGNLNIVKLLVLRGFSLDDKDKIGYTPLHYLAKRGDESLAPFVIQMVKSIDVPCLRRRTPLHLSLLNGNHGIGKLLLKSGADVRVKDKLGRNALHNACLYGDPDMVREVLKYRPEVNARDSEMLTPVLLSVRRNRGPEIVPLLVANGADINIPDKEGQTPLYIAAVRPVPDPHNILSCLLDHGADIMKADSKYFRTPLEMMMLLQGESKAGLMMAHALRLKALGFLPEYQPPEDEFYKNILDQDYYDRCISELATMKNIEVTKTFSMLDFLTEAQGKVLDACKNFYRMRRRLDPRYEQAFPIYWRMMEFKWNNVDEKYRLLCGARSFFSNMRPRLPRDIISLILSYLPFEDWTVFHYFSQQNNTRNYRKK